MRCLVFGGTGSVGSELRKVLAREGARVAYTWHSVEAPDGGQLARRCDLRDAASIREAVDGLARELGGLDAIVFATGVSARRIIAKMEEVRLEDLDELLSVNTRGIFLACQAALPHLKAARGGNIVVIGSMDGIKTVPSPVHFAASKAALKGMIEAMSKELGDFGIRANLIAPGILESGAAAALPEELKRDYLKYCSLERFGKPSEVAEVAAWFALENTYITGQSVLLDGGL